MYYFLNLFIAFNLPQTTLCRVIIGLELKSLLAARKLFNRIAQYSWSEATIPNRTFALLL